MVNVQSVPLKVYRGRERITIAAPMPGLEPEDITVEITQDRRLVLDGALRGTLDENKEVLADEWNPGPYHREIDLPSDVHGEMANLSYGNGVLVVVLPVTDWTRPARLTFGAAIEPAQGQRVGHTGNPPWSTVTEEYFDREGHQTGEPEP
jgi:HSP20 family protein